MVNMAPIFNIVDVLFEAIVDFSTRIIVAYVYADEPKVKSVTQEKISETSYALPSPVHSVAQQISLPRAVNEETESVYTTPTTRGSIMYISSIEAPLFGHPTISFDDEIARIPYGSMVCTFKPHGRFFPVTWGTMQGWILQDDVVDTSVTVYPTFSQGAYYTVDNPSTSRIRALLKDPFGLSRSELPLQAGEYVLYRLWRNGKHIAWPDIRPRVPGNWHHILKGLASVYMSLIPKTGSIMEYVDEHEVGYLAYVESVLPDETIMLSEVNNTDCGVYTERTYTKAEWKELRPVFIEVR